MKVMRNVSKKVMVAIMSASMAMTPAAGALAVPMTVCATDPSNTIENNTENLDDASDVIIEENNANIYSLHTGGTVEITTSSDPVKEYIPDRPDTGDMDYTYNYTEANFNAVKAKCDNITKDILIKLPDGTGVFYKGKCQTWYNEVSVGSPIEATLHTVPSVAPEYKTSAEVTALIDSE